VAQLLADSLEYNKVDITSPASLAGVGLDVRSVHEWYAGEKA